MRVAEKLDWKGLSSAQVTVEICMVSCWCINKEVKLKSKPKHTGTWSALAWLSVHLCCNPAIFFSHLYHTAPWFSHGKIWHVLQFFFLSLSPIPPHVHIDFVVRHPGCGRSSTNFCGWSTHRAWLCWMIWVMMICMSVEYLNSTSYPDHGWYGDLPLQGKIPTAEPGIEPGTSWLVVIRSDHQATRLVCCKNVISIFLYFFFSKCISL
jgi:hypothetical protein